jgi:hypothetical protein
MSNLKDRLNAVGASANQHQLPIALDQHQLSLAAQVQSLHQFEPPVAAGFTQPRKAIVE